jgi:hypothetical protein
VSRSFCPVQGKTRQRRTFGRRGVAQLVARTAGGREVAGSSPVTPTINNGSGLGLGHYYCLGCQIGSAAEVFH